MIIVLNTCSNLEKEAAEEHEAKKKEVLNLASTQSEELDKLRKEHEETRKAEEAELR